MGFLDDDWAPRMPAVKLADWLLANGYRESYAGGSYGWRGAIVQNGKRVWTCGHPHRSRDHGTSHNPSARGCASAELQRRWQEDIGYKPYRSTN